MKNLLFTALLAIITTSLFSQTDILPPVLAKPTDGATNQMPNAELDWYAVSGVGSISYEVQIDTSDQFLNPVILTTALTAINAQNLLFGDDYFWKVRAIDNSGSSDWSTVFDFTVFNVVALNKPIDNAAEQMPDVNLEWSNRKGANFITGITYYDLQASFYEDFSSLCIVDSLAFGEYPATDNYVHITSSDLLFDTTYYWRVRARHDLDATEWSDPWSFSTIAGVTLTGPANGAINQDPEITLSWTALTGINDFIYQVCSDPEFTFPCITGLVDGASASVTVPELLFGHTYYWRVQAAHNADTSSFTEVRSFQVINAVLLQTPANGASGVATLPTLVWLPIHGIDGFEARVYNESFTYNDTAFLDTNLYNVYKPMEQGNDYFWKVRTFSNGDTTNWSEVWQFHVGPQAVNDIVLQKNNVRLYPNPCQGMLFAELNSITGSVIEVVIMDFVGKEVYKNTLNFKQGIDTRNIDVSNLKEGLYFIRLKLGSNTYSEKFIISK
jgi:hypothetical protein